MQYFCRNLLRSLAFVEKQESGQVLVQLPKDESGTQMTKKIFGQPLQRPGPDEVLSTGGARPGLCWKISEKTQREIEEIEENSRTAGQQSGSIVFG